MIKVQGDNQQRGDVGRSTPSGGNVTNLTRDFAYTFNGNGPFGWR